MEKTDSAKSPTWKSVYAPTKQKQLNPAGCVESGRGRLVSSAGRELRPAPQLAAGVGRPAISGRETNDAGSPVATAARHSAPGTRPNSVVHTAAVRGVKSPPAGKGKQSVRRKALNLAPRAAGSTAPPAQLQNLCKQAHELHDTSQQQRPHSQQPFADHPDSHEHHVSLEACLQEATAETEAAAAGRRASSSPRQMSRQPGAQLLSPYLAPLARPPSSIHRRPRSPGPRPGSPLSGLRRLPTRDRNSTSGGQSAPVNSTVLASSIYGRQQLSSRLGMRPASRQKRPHFHPQQHCTFEIQVNYGPDKPQSQSVGRAPADDHSMTDAPVVVNQQLTARTVEQQSGSGAGGFAVEPTAGQGWTGIAGTAGEPELGMTLSEYIAQMHTTPVACNSVSGLGDESDDEQFVGAPSWHAAPTGGSILAAWGMPSTAEGFPEDPQTAGSSSLGAVDNAGQAQHTAAAIEDPQAATHMHSQHEQMQPGSCSSSCSIDEAMHTNFDAFRGSEGPSDIECYPDIDSSSESEAEYQMHTKVTAGLAAVGGAAGTVVANQTPWLETSEAAPAAGASALTGDYRPQFGSGQRNSGTLSPTMSIGDKRPSVPWMNRLDLRPATASNSISWRSRAAADMATGPGAIHGKPLGGSGTGSQQRSFTDLDLSAEGVVKQVSLGHLSAALFAPTAAVEGGGSRASLQQLWASSSFSDGANSDRSSLGRPGAQAAVAAQPQSGAGSSSGWYDGSVDEQAFDEAPTSPSGPNTAVMRQHPSTVVAWGAPAVRASTAAAGQTAAGTAPTPTELNSDPKRLFNTRALGPYQKTPHHQAQQQALQRPPSRQKPPAQSLHLFTAAGFMPHVGPTQAGSAGGRAGLFDSRPGTAGVAVNLQGLDRPGSAVQRGAHRPVSATQ